MVIENTPINGLKIIKPKVYRDERGYFLETYRKDVLLDHDIKVDFVQENQSHSKYGVIRGLHFQKPPHAQGKLIRVLNGKILDVVVDLRKSSATFGQVYSIELDDQSMTQFWIPAGFAHGFSVLSPQATIHYKCDQYYHPASEGGILWKDPNLAIDWGIDVGEAIVSEKDQQLPLFQSMAIKF